MYTSNLIKEKMRLQVKITTDRMHTCMNADSSIQICDMFRVLVSWPVHVRGCTLNLNLSQPSTRISVKQILRVPNRHAYAHMFFWNSVVLPANISSTEMPLFIAGIVFSNTVFIVSLHFLLWYTHDIFSITIRMENFAVREYQSGKTRHRNANKKKKINVIGTCWLNSKYDNLLNVLAWNNRRKWHR